MRRFEFSDGKSNKFWEIEVEGERTTTRHGRIGTAGRSTTKTFFSAAAAKKKAESQIASKLKKGYVEVQDDDSATADPERDDDSPLATTERRLIAEPDELESWAIYADLLSEAGDPRVELVSLYVAKAKVEIERKFFRQREKELLETHADAWFGKFVSRDDWRECFGWTFEMGFWGRIRLWVDYDHDGTDIPQALAYALAHPSATFLRELDIGLTSADGMADYEGCIRALVRPLRRRGHRGLRPLPRAEQGARHHHHQARRLPVQLPVRRRRGPDLDQRVVRRGGLDLPRQPLRRLRSPRRRTPARGPTRDGGGVQGVVRRAWFARRRPPLGARADLPAGERVGGGAGSGVGSVNGPRKVSGEFTPASANRRRLQARSLLDHQR